MLYVTCTARSDYEELRRQLLNNPITGPGLPRFVHTCRDLSQFWQFIKYKYRTYAERREYIWDEFRPLLELVEARATTPLQPTDEQVLSPAQPGVRADRVAASA